MFNSIYSYFSNLVDTSSNNFKINIFFFINIRLFKLKLNNSIVFMLNSLNSLNFKKIKVFYNFNNFTYFYSIFISYFIVFSLFLTFFI